MMRKKALLTLKIAGCAFILLAVAYAAIYGMSAIALRNAYAELKANGRPANAEEIIPKDVKDVDNAGPLYVAAANILRTEKWGEQSLYDFIADAYSQPKSFAFIADAYSQPKSFAAKKDKVRDALQSETAKTAFRLIEEGVKKPSCRFFLREAYDQGPDMLLPEVNWQRNLTRILCVKARVEAEDGRKEDAWDTIIVAMKMADAMRDEPNIICQLVRDAKLSMLFNDMQKICDIAAPSERQAAELETALKLFEDREPIARGFDGERILSGEWMFSRPMSLNFLKFFTGAPLPYRLLAFSPAYQLDRATNIRIYAQYANQASSNKNEHPKAPLYCPIARTLSSGVGMFKTKGLEAIARAKIAKLALRVIAKGGVAKLSEVGSGEELVDPFSEKEFVYKADGKGFTLYSVGINRVDNGGRKSGELGGTTDDIIWRWQK